MNKFTRVAALGSALYLVVVFAGTADAQKLGEDTAGYPILVASVLLTAGHQYRISTDYTLTHISGMGVADTVLTVIPGGWWFGTESNFSNTFGSDGCSVTGHWEESCVSFTVPTPAPPGGIYDIYVRAWRQSTAGRTHVYVYDLTTPMGCTPSIPCGGSLVCVSQPAGGSLCAADIAGGLATFGGGFATTNIASGTGRVFLSTTERPGNNLQHEILSYAQDEVTIVHGARNNGRIAGTAMVDGDANAKNEAGGRYQIFGSTYIGYTGPVRLIRNDWFVAGNDTDGDGLGDLLERDLKTCDRTSDPNPSPGFACASLPGCTSPSSLACKQSLRDTDHDGLRDDLELFGYDNLLLHIARWGAEPAHMDRFIELDTIDQRDNAVTHPGCQGFVAGTSPTLDGIPPDYIGTWQGDALGNAVSGRKSLDDIQTAYNLLPASYNPDGTPGVRVHFDVGVANPRQPTDPLYTVWGAWGGGNTCVPITCDYRLAYNNDSSGGCPSGVFDQSRKWVFQYGIDGIGQGGVTSFDNTTIAGLTADWIHELGHSAALQHSGPPGTTGGYENDFGNGRPNYVTRMNYSYEFFGGQWYEQTSASTLTFSTGTLATRGLNPIRADEVCPYASADLSKLVFAGERASYNSGTGCWDVDWNQDLIVAGTTQMRRLWAGGYNIRWTRVRPAGVRYARLDATLVGDVLLTADVRPDSVTGVPTIALRGESNKDCPEWPSDIRTATASDSFYGTAGSLPGCYRSGIEVPLRAANAVALENAHTPSGVEGVIAAYVTSAGAVGWYELAVVPNASSTEMSVTYSHDWGAIPGITSSTLFGTAPDLVRTPDGGLLLTVTDSSYSAYVWQSYLAYGGSTWTPWSLALNASGYAVYGQGAMAVYGTDLWRAVNRGSAIDLYKLDSTGTPLSARRWNLQFSYAVTAGDGPTNGALEPAIAFMTDPELGIPRLYVYYVAVTTIAGTPPRYLSRLFFQRSGTSGGFGVSEGPVLVDPTTGSAPTALFDTRTGLVPAPDLRLWRSGGDDCTDGCASGFACGTTTTCIDSGGRPYGDLNLYPFARGPAPGYYTDYNDWPGVQWGVCHAREVTLAPTYTNTYIPTSYQDNARCGFLPIYNEPTPSGMSPLSVPSANDRVDHPDIYTAW